MCISQLIIHKLSVVGHRLYIFVNVRNVSIEVSIASLAAAQFKLVHYLGDIDSTSLPCSTIS